MYTGQFMKIIITLDSLGIFCSNFVYLCILTFSATGMKKGDEASPSIILAGRALVVKMHITLEPCCAFGSKFEYLCILALPSHCYAKQRRGFTKHHFGRSSSFNENAHNS